MKILQPKQSFKSPIWAEKPKSGNTVCNVMADKYTQFFLIKNTVKFWLVRS